MDHSIATMVGSSAERDRDLGPIESELNRSFGLLDQLGAEIGNLTDRLRIALNPSEMASIRATTEPTPPTSTLLSRLQDLSTKAGVLIETVQSVNVRIEL